MKFVHRLLTAPNTPWARWVRIIHFNNRDVGDRLPLNTRTWSQINTHLRGYREVTCLQIRDGETTSFWKDKWTTNGPFYIQFPAIYSHALRPNISVADCRRGREWIIHTQHITSDRTDNELHSLALFLNSVCLQEGSLDK